MQCAATSMRRGGEEEPKGVDCRKNMRLRRRAYHTKGPNFIWHFEGHDKVKSFGLSIHACIDQGPRIDFKSGGGQAYKYTS